MPRSPKWRTSSGSCVKLCGDATMFASDIPRGINSSARFSVRSAWVSVPLPPADPVLQLPIERVHRDAQIARPRPCDLRDALARDVRAAVGLDPHREPPPSERGHDGREVAPQERLAAGEDDVPRAERAELFGDRLVRLRLQLAKLRADALMPHMRQR